MNVDGPNSTKHFKGVRYEENSNTQLASSSSTRTKRPETSSQTSLSDSYFDYPEMLEYFKAGLLLPNRIAQINAKYRPAAIFMTNKRILDLTDHDMI